MLLLVATSAGCGESSEQSPDMAVTEAPDMTAADDLAAVQDDSGVGNDLGSAHDLARPFPDFAGIDCGGDYDVHEGDRAAPTCMFGAGDNTISSVGPCIPHGTDLAGKIDHIVVVMQENRSFDHYFSHLPQYGVTDVNVASDTASNPQGVFNATTGLCMPTAGSLSRYHETRYCIFDTEHDWMPTHAQYNNGAMDGFLCTNNDTTGAGGQRALGYYTDVDIPYYYWLAKNFSISDTYFSSLLGPTYPNRYFLYSATAFGRTQSANTPSEAPPEPQGQTQNIFFELDQGAHTWKIYKDGAVSFGTLYGAAYAGVPFQNFALDVQANTLPDVSFIDPDWTGTPAGHMGNDEHPPSNMQVGEQYVAGIISTLTSNPTVWQKSALFFTYDEHGGYYDHVPPPPACKPDATDPTDPYPILYHYDRYGVRVPLIVVSPYAKKGYVSHKVMDHTSILRFIENRFNLPAMTKRDANAWPMLDLFDFANPPFMNFPTGAPSTTPSVTGQTYCTANPNGGTGGP